MQLRWFFICFAVGGWPLTAAAQSAHDPIDGELSVVMEEYRTDINWGKVLDGGRGVAEGGIAIGMAVEFMTGSAQAGIGDATLSTVLGVAIAITGGISLVNAGVDFYNGFGSVEEGEVYARYRRMMRGGLSDTERLTIEDELRLRAAGAQRKRLWSGIHGAVDISLAVLFAVLSTTGGSNGQALFPTNPIYPAVGLGVAGVMNIASIFITTPAERAWDKLLAAGDDYYYDDEEGPLEDELPDGTKPDPNSPRRKPSPTEEAPEPVFEEDDLEVRWVPWVLPDGGGMAIVGRF